MCIYQLRMQLEYVNINPPQPMDKLTVDGGNGNGSAKNKRMQAGKKYYLIAKKICNSIIISIIICKYK